MHVIFVPALAGLLGRGSRVVIWLAAGMAVLGVGLLSHDGSPPNVGDGWTLACAVVWAIYITRLETLTSKLPSTALTAAHLWVVVVLSAGWMAVAREPVGAIPWKAILYLGLAATAATTWFQTIGQKVEYAAGGGAVHAGAGVGFGVWVDFFEGAIGVVGMGGGGVDFVGGGFDVGSVVGEEGVGGGGRRLGVGGGGEVEVGRLWWIDAMQGDGSTSCSCRVVRGVL